MVKNESSSLSTIKTISSIVFCMVDIMFVTTNHQAESNDEKKNIEKLQKES